uniref:Uncharacterized protein n=1 Tax=Rhizophora mucronata TaxID=61149 RepID=A0A2P2M4E3_RHIMU
MPPISPLFLLFFSLWLLLACFLSLRYRVEKEKVRKRAHV